MLLLYAARSGCHNSHNENADAEFAAEHHVVGLEERAALGTLPFVNRGAGGVEAHFQAPGSGLRAPGVQTTDSRLQAPVQASGFGYRAI